MAILQALEGKSQAELIAMIAALQAGSERKLTLKVSEKGAVALYGLGRFPVTLYKGQWERLLGEVTQIKAFIVANESLLSVKPVKGAVA